MYGQGMTAVANPPAKVQRSDGPTVTEALTRLEKAIAAWRERLDQCMEGTVALETGATAPDRSDSEVEEIACPMVGHIRHLEYFAHEGARITEQLGVRIAHLGT